jgi:hypothetical protein
VGDVDDDEEEDDDDEQNSTEQEAEAAKKAIEAKIVELNARKARILRCLAYLHHNGIHLQRALYFANEWSNRGISMTDPKPQLFRLAPETVMVTGSNHPGGFYHPAKNY